MNKAKGLKRITNLIAVIVILLGVIPFTAAANITTVYADGEETTEPAETVTETTPVEEASSAPEVEEAAPADNTEAGGNETAPAEETVNEGEAAEEADAAEESEDAVGEPAAEEAENEVAEEVDADVAEETADAVEEPVAAAVEETVETEAAVDVSEIVEILSEAEVQIVDENGEALPLASVEAVEVLEDSDPFFSRWNSTTSEWEWIGYTKSGTGCPANVTCYQNDFPFQEAVNQAGAGNTIYVAGGEYKEAVVVNHADQSFTAFQSITVPDDTSIQNATVNSFGYALVDKITLNVDFGTTIGVYAKEVIVNGAGTADGWLDDGMALVNDGGTIEADMKIVGATGGHYDVKDAYHDIKFEWECGEPNAPISVGTIYRMILKDPSNQDILDYYTVHGDERKTLAPDYLDLPAADRLEDLLIGVNLSEEKNWGYKDEERIYWYLLGNTGKDNNGRDITLKKTPTPGSQQDRADEITGGDHDAIDRTHNIWFLWPKSQSQGRTELSPYIKGTEENKDKLQKQLTFFVYETRVVYGCMDPEAENYDPNATIDNEDCVYPKSPPTTTTTDAAFGVPGVGGLDLITAGIGHTCALTAKEGLECWGLNESGQVGDSSFDDTLVPVDVVGINPAGVIGLVSGIHHTCVLTSANEVFCWGLNSSGQLGDGTTENRNEPILVDGLEGKITAISAGAEFTCALNDANDVFCWGNNSSGQLNDGTEDHSSIPVKTTTVSSDTVLISGGSLELQGITSDGAMQLWNSQPVIPVTGLPEEDNAFVSADRFTEGGCTMTEAGDVNCWGGITDAQVKGAVVNDMLSSGQGHACTMKAEGLVCWGSNSNGQLGNDSTNDSLEETLVVELEQGVIALAAGMKHTCVIYADEDIACWGLNDYGQLGNDTIDDSMVPVTTK